MNKKIIITISILVLLPLLAIFCSNNIITNSAKGKTFYNVDAIPYNKVGVVLGTTSKLVNGSPNPYYVHRINATVALYNAKKIDFVLVSGDNGTKYYNEPDTFKRELVKQGIPEDKIFLDYAGFRTLDSMVRAHVIFGLNKVTVISQKFHNERAIYIAEKKGLTTVGFNAKDLKGKAGLKVQTREYLARVKVFLDLLLNTEPKFYGEKITIE
ncbi:MULTISPECIES: SanA/YdcF family protein [unclassified Cellulophaga]|uniref:SanA/YdcF family protein n=1 Tax=unclassified Cellulophaga TaxID=2634405 RepID=UPI0026E36A9A|nr:MULTISPECIES: ElyC/SanA/YdcF family protein [unclassified Cellulophaga]MDO6490319.1 ElyC/SanA/YdcF family protein [Cellulophaga sp. 2_MG-2023]MDO6494487.1 ElyC/SanA/YdcF family protein [Cellulophaga sp. 3_MG-2023]